MKVRNHETKKFQIRKIVIEDNDYINGYKVSLVVNNKYIEYIHRGKYIDNIFEEIESYLKILVECDSDTYIKL